MSDFWGPADRQNPTYTQALRQFVRYQSKNSELISGLARMYSDQAMLESKWFSRREEMRRNGATPERLASFDRRIHVQATEFSKDLTKKLGERMHIALFAPSHSGPTVREDRVRFMQFLSDLLDDRPREVKVKKERID